MVGLGAAALAVVTQAAVGDIGGVYLALSHAAEGNTASTVVGALGLYHTTMWSLAATVAGAGVGAVFAVAALGA